MSARRTPLRIGFAGTPKFAAIILQALLAADGHVVVVYTQPDRPAGRGRKLLSSAVKQLAVAHDIEVRQPVSLRGDAQPIELATWNVDLLIVAAYGLILPTSILAVPKYGCINVHASLLPRWRGAAPVERAIMAGDQQTGVSIMQMDAGLDTGPVLAYASCPIDDDTVGPDLDMTLADLGARCLLGCLSELHTIQPTPQADVASYASKLTADDAVIHWSHSARSIHRQIRALCGRRPAVTALGNLRIKLLAATWRAEPTNQAPGIVMASGADGIEVACGNGSLVVHRVQLNRGKGRPLTAVAAINGYPAVFTPGARLGGGD